MSRNIAILVVSCDKYSDLWDPFFQIFHLRWSDCPYPIYLGTNYRTFQDDKVTTIRIGQDRQWGANLQLMLNHIDADRVILFLEDFFLVRQVNTTDVARLVRIAQDNEVVCLRLRPNPGPTKAILHYRNLGVLQPGDDYRISTQVAIWDVPFLRRLALPDFTAWEFETTGTLLGDRLQGSCWGVYEPVIDYRHGVYQRRWLKRGIEICHEAGVMLDLSSRPVLSDREWKLYQLDQIMDFKRLAKRLLPRPITRYFRLKRSRPFIDELVARTGIGR